MATILGKCKFRMMYVLTNDVILSLYKEWKQNRSKHSKELEYAELNVCPFSWPEKGVQIPPKMV